ncbi:xanthotoxin 5-hydroxylase CYP82C4-like [Andrographis paniculata]|uniref:xanthotoxin 5-hydroxylase CYP82C4-like n=1 Tax=Andrographis paniculata TaxID=175694 RepID=UPI0021E908A5|nr:xanthotoxin 5-hydroxylase CYP82C4-like [Andrographis paniculata]
MEVNNPLFYSPWIAALISLAVAASFYLLVVARKSYANDKSSTKLPPMASGGWPLIGHLFRLSGPEPLHINLSKMTDKYGPIFSLRVGARRAVVLNSWETARDCYRTNDVAFSNRAKTAAVRLMGYDFAMLGFSDHGPYWREMRKISVLRLLSNRKVAALGNMVKLQIREQMKSLNEEYYSRGGDEMEMVVVPDMRKFFGDVTVSLMIRTVAGNVEKETNAKKMENWKKTIREFFEMMNVITVSDVLPAFKWVDYFGGMHRAFRKTGKSFDAMLQTWLTEHKKLKKVAEQGEDDDDFMSEMLRASDSVAEEFPFFDADTINKATCQTMMVGGVDTMTVTLIWAVCLLLNNRETLIRAQEELDKHVGRDRLVNESDLEKLPYIRAIIKETLRVQPAVPVIPRQTGEACEVGGYHIPAGTMVFINTWRIQRDPEAWRNSLEFRPERFLTDDVDVDVQGLHFELTPFGGGRRICPAISFAMKTMQLALGSFLQGFDLRTLSGEEDVDMEGSFGSTNLKATPLEVCLRPRLPRQLYASVC